MMLIWERDTRILVGLWSRGFNPCSGNSLIRSRCHLTGFVPFPKNCQVTEFLEMSDPGLYQACSMAIWPFTTSIWALGISTTWASPGRATQKKKNQNSFSVMILIENKRFRRVCCSYGLWRQTKTVKTKIQGKKRRKKARFKKEKILIFNSQGGQSPEPDSWTWISWSQQSMSTCVSILRVGWKLAHKDKYKLFWWLNPVTENVPRCTLAWGRRRVWWSIERRRQTPHLFSPTRLLLSDRQEN